MWYKDTAGHMHDLGNENVGATKRRNLTDKGNKVDMIGYMHDDVFRQTRLLPPAVTVKVRFVGAIEQFSLADQGRVQNGYFQSNFVREEMKGQPSGLAGASKHPPKELHVCSNNASGL